MSDIKNYDYSDINLWAGSVSNNALVFDEKAVEQNIMMMFMTPIKSCWFDPPIGTNILTYLFDPVDDVTAFKIKREMETVLPRNGETRLVFNKVDVLPDPDNNDFYCRIEYSLPGLDYKKFSFDFTLSQMGQA
jgi:phage baseplate assembly protein W